MTASYLSVMTLLPTMCSIDWSWLQTWELATLICDFLRPWILDPLIEFFRIDFLLF